MDSWMEVLVLILVMEEEIFWKGMSTLNSIQHDEKLTSRTIIDFGLFALLLARSLARSAYRSCEIASVFGAR